MSRVFAFSNLILDPGRRSLCRRGTEVPIGDRAFGVLLVLVERAGEVVSKRELLDAVWSDVVVVEDNLVKAVGELRSALGDSPAEPHFIRTIHRRGYTFIAPVERIEPAGRENPPAVSPTRPTARSTRVVVVGSLTLAVAAVVAIAVVAGVGWSRGPGADVPDLTVWRLRELSLLGGPMLKPVFAHSGEMMAAVAADPATGIHSLFLVNLAGGATLRLTNDIEVRGPSPVFSADGATVLFTTYVEDPVDGLRPEVWGVPVLGGEPHRVLEWASAVSPNPAGRSFAYAAVTPAGTTVRVRGPDGTDHELARRGYWPRWSPDGRWIAYTTSDPEGGAGDLWVVRPDGTDARRLTDRPGQIYGLAWWPHSHGLVFTVDRDDTSNLWYASVDGEVLRPAARGPGDFSAPTVAPDGRRVVFSFSVEEGRVALADSLAAPFERLLVDEGVFRVALDPRAHRLAVAVGRHGHQPALSLIDLDGDRRTVVSGLSAEHLSWAPDGHSLLATAPSPDGSTAWIWRIPVDGGLPEPVLRGVDGWSWPAAAPDGRRLAAARTGPDGLEVVVCDLETGDEVAVAEPPCVRDLSWSPDGTWLAWSGGSRPADSTALGIWIAASVGGPSRRVAPDGEMPRWVGPDTLLFVRSLDHRGVWAVGLDGAPSRLAKEFGPDLILLETLDFDAGAGGSPLVILSSSLKPLLYSLEAPSP